MNNQISSEDIEVIYKNYELVKNELIQDIRSSVFGYQIINYIQQIIFCLFLIPILINKGLIQDKSNNDLTTEEFFSNLKENKSTLNHNLYSIFTAFRSKSAIKKIAINTKQYTLLLKEMNIIDSQIHFKDLTKLNNDWSVLFQFVLNTTRKFGVNAIDSLSFIYERDLNFIEDLGDENQSESKINRFLTERRKKGVYFTPQKITSFMNKLTIFSLLKNKTKMKIDALKDLTEIRAESKLLEIHSILSKIQILDMACGSGDFLIESAQQLYELLSYLNEKLRLKKTNWEIKKNILENNIFGVDLLPKAISIIKVRLWIWFIKDLTKEELTQDIINSSSFNLKVGNSLIGWDNEFEKKLMENYTEHERIEIKPFNWENNFDKVLSNGGFDIVIGNPPYIEIKKMRNEIEKRIYNSTYQAAYKLYDISILFIERGLALLKEGGILSFIITNKFIASDFGLKIREHLLTKTKIINLVDLSYLAVFTKIATYPIILTVEKSNKTKLDDLLDNTIEIIPKVKSLEQLRSGTTTTLIKQLDFYNLPQKLFIISPDISLVLKINQITNIIRIGELGKFAYRLLGFTDWISSLDYLSPDKKSEKDLLFIGTANVARYLVQNKKELTLAKRRLKEHYLNYNEKFVSSWEIFLEPKLLIREIAKKLTVAVDPGKYSNATGIYMFLPNNRNLLKFFLVLLNSKLLNRYFSTLYESTHMSGGYLRFNSSYLKQLPVLLPESKEDLFIFNRFADYILLLKYIFYEDQTNNPELEKLIEFYIEIIDLLVLELYLKDIVKTKLTPIIFDSFNLEKTANEKFGKNEIIDFANYTIEKLEKEFLPLIKNSFAYLNSNQDFNSEKEKILEGYSSNALLRTAME
ncbi:MAG TPA: DNA methyltransferase [Candidatus Bathyarchaeia archaeon]|nr:DNA methyltransferase [Candidatus Bathyarchaeia archaeon]